MIHYLNEHEAENNNKKGAVFVATLCRLEFVSLYDCCENYFENNSADQVSL